jgi:hypothetical protein
MDIERSVKRCGPRLISPRGKGATVTMDIAELAGFLMPFLPYLMKAGEAAMEKAAGDFGRDSWELAKSLWAKLRPKVEDRAAAREAAEDVVARPADDRARGALELQLEKLLQEDNELAEQIREIWERYPATTVVVASGERSIASGGSTRGVFVTGDQNTIRE